MEQNAYLLRGSEVPSRTEVAKLHSALVWLLYKMLKEDRVLLLVVFSCWVFFLILYNFSAINLQVQKGTKCIIKRLKGKTVFIGYDGTGRSKMIEIQP